MLPANYYIQLVEIILRWTEIVENYCGVFGSPADAVFDGFHRLLSCADSCTSFGVIFIELSNLKKNTFKSNYIILSYMDGMTKPMACFQDAPWFAPSIVCGWASFI